MPGIGDTKMIKIASLFTLLAIRKTVEREDFGRIGKKLFTGYDGIINEGHLTLPRS